LIEDDEFVAFYRDSLKTVRGRDLVEWLRLRLTRAHGGASYKALIMGHSGVGKTTEMTRLVRELGSSFHAIRFSSSEQLDPVSFQPFDVLLLMISEVIQKTSLPVGEGGAGKRPSGEVLRPVLDWYSSIRTMERQSTEAGASAEAGAGLSADSLWSKVLGVFGRVRAEMKYASTREKETVEYRLSRLDDLIRAANAVFRECNLLLRAATGAAEWMFIGEDFDKAGIPPETTERLFLTYSNMFRELDVHMIFSLPIALGYSERAPGLPVSSDDIFCLPDTMVFTPDHQAHAEGRLALRIVLAARIAENLFGPEQMEQLIVASGGNLRDLFSLVSYAADSALLRESAVIEVPDVSAAIRNLRKDFENRLGQSPYDVLSRCAITYEQKAERLMKIYDQDPLARIPGPELYSLLHARAVQEFNGERWFGVHPLVVDILAAQGRIHPSQGGRVVGGTE